MPGSSGSGALSLVSGSSSSTLESSSSMLESFLSSFVSSDSANPSSAAEKELGAMKGFPSVIVGSDGLARRGSVGCILGFGVIMVKIVGAAEGVGFFVGLGVGVLVGLFGSKGGQDLVQTEYMLLQKRCREECEFDWESSLVFIETMKNRTNR